MNKHEKSVKNVENIINADRNEPIELEISMMIQNNDEGQQVFPGVQLYVPGSDMPIFIAAGELLVLAKASEKYCQELIEGNSVKKPASKAKKPSA